MLSFVKKKEYTTKVHSFYDTINIMMGSEVIMSIEKVKKYFADYGVEDKVVELEESSATVSEAARAIGCVEAEIAKTLSFNVDDEAILIVLAGDTKIENNKYRECFNTKAKMLEHDEVEPLIGHPIGGVCPFAVKENVKIYLDESLKRFEYVYPACGTSHSAIKLTIPELEKYSKYTSWVDVGVICDEK